MEPMEGLPTEGTFGVVDPVTLLCYLWERSFSGAVKIEEGETHRIIYIEGGEVVSMATSHPGEKIDDILIAQGQITPEHVRHALEASPSIADLPEKLMDLGFVTLLELKQAYAQQVQTMITHFAGYPAGIYSIIDGYKPSRDTRIRLPIPKIVADFFARTENRDFVISLIGNLAFPVLFNDEKREIYDSLEMGPDADTMITLMDGHRTMAELSAQSQWKEFDVYRLFALLLVLGLARRIKAGESVEKIKAEEEMKGKEWRREESDLSPALPSPEVAGIEEPPSLPTIDTLSAPEILSPSVEEEKISPVNSEALDVGEMDVEKDEFANEEEVIDEEMEVEEEKVEEILPESAVLKKPQIQSIKPEPEMIARDHSSDRRAKRRRIMVIYPLIGIVAVLVAGALAMLYLQGRNHQKTPPPEKTPIQVAPEEIPENPQSPAAEGESGATQEAEIPQSGKHQAKSPASSTVKSAAVPAPQAAVKPPHPGGVKKTAPGKQKSASPIRQKARDHLEKFTALPGSHGTIQLMIACQEDSIIEAERHDSQAHDLWFVSYTYRGRSCFKVFWGHYTSVEKAREAISTLPAYFKKDSHPKAIPLSRALAHLPH